MRCDAVMVLGKELRRDPGRAVRELMARSAAAAAVSRPGERPIIALEAPLQGQDRAGSALVAEYLQRLGVPRARMVLGEITRSTREEALEACRLARERGWSRLLVVTSLYHVPRARRQFEEVFGAPVPVFPPEALLRFARPREREWILRGTPGDRELAVERKVEALLHALALAVRPLPAPLRWRLEVRAAAVLRGCDR